MKWLASVRAVLAGGSRSAPVTPAASPNLPSKADLRAKQVSCNQNYNRTLEKPNFHDGSKLMMCLFWVFPLQLNFCIHLE